MEKLEKNINYAWERFYLDMMRLSKAGLFSKANEIVSKREIRDLLISKLSDLRPEQIRKLLCCENVLEEAYRYVLDYKTPRKSVERLICEYLES